MLNPEFTAMLRGMGEEFATLARELEEGTPEVSVRLNAAKRGCAPAGADSVVPWCAEGTYLKERLAFTLDPAMHQGRYYVQDASSMSLSHVIGRLAAELGPGPLRLLDACAAPGGKTLCAADHLPAGSLVVANEYDPRRAAVLRENVTKWGAAPMTVVSRGDTARFRRLEAAFDIVCVDAPCSGEGMMRKDATARAQWSPRLVAECAARQREILDNVWPSVRPGGFLVYSTCTFNPTENEELIGAFAADNDAEFIDTGLTEFAGILPSVRTGVLAARFLPGRVRGEGLFVSVVRKAGSQAGLPPRDRAPRPAKRRGKSEKPVAAITPQQLRELRGWVDLTRFTVEAIGEAAVALPTPHRDFIAGLRPHLDIISQGAEVATVRGRDLVPSHTLAMSPSLWPSDTLEAFPSVEVDRDTALHYLRAEAVTLSADTPRGYVLLTHATLPLGFAKNLGNRANNLYPSPWRILKTL